MSFGDLFWLGYELGSSDPGMSFAENETMPFPVEPLGARLERTREREPVRGYIDVPNLPEYVFRIARSLGSSGGPDEGERYDTRLVVVKPRKPLSLIVRARDGFEVRAYEVVPGRFENRARLEERLIGPVERRTAYDAGWTIVWHVRGDPETTHAR